MKVPMEEDEGREDGGFAVTTAQVLDEDVKKNFVSESTFQKVSWLMRRTKQDDEQERLVTTVSWWLVQHFVLKNIQNRGVVNGSHKWITQFQDGVGEVAVQCQTGDLTTGA